MNSRQCIAPFFDELREGRSHGAIAALDEEPLRGVANPAVGIRQADDECGGVFAREPGKRRGPFRGGDDAINAPVVDALVKAARERIAAQVGGHELAVLRDAAVEIHDPERAIGAVVETRRAEALISRGEKFAVVVGELRGEREVAVGDEVAFEEVQRGIGHEGVADELGRKIIAAIDERPARGGEHVGAAGGIEHLGRVAAVDSGVHPNGKHALIGGDEKIQARRSRVVRVAAHVIRRRVVAHELAVVHVVDEAAPVVLRHAPLAAHFGGLPHERAADEAVAIRGLAVVDPVVHRAEQAVGGVLDVAAAVVGVHEFGAVGLAVAIGVACEKELVVGNVEHAAGDRGDSARQDQLVHKHRGLVEAPVAIGVFEPRDARDRLAFAGAVDVDHVAAHLDDVGAAVLVEREGDRILDHRLARGQFEFETIRESHRRHRVLRGEHGRRRRHG